MVIKLKSKYIDILLLIISIYILALSFISISDFNENKSYLDNNAYFHSSKFENTFLDYLQNVKSLVNYSQDYKEILSSDEFDNPNKNSMKAFYESEIEKIKFELNSKNLYWSKSIRYYIEDKNDNQIYSNLEKGADLKNLVQNDSLYSINFPNSDISLGSFTYANSWFEDNEFQGTFVILKNTNSQLQNDYNYYNSIKDRVIKEVFIGFFSLIIGFYLLLYMLKKRNFHLANLINIFNKVPLDLKIIILIICSFLINGYVLDINFFSFPLGVMHILKLSIVAVYTFCFIFSIIGVVNIIKNKKTLINHCKQTYLYKFGVNLKDSFMIKGVFGKSIMLFLFTMLLGIFIIAFFWGISIYSSTLTFVSAFYIFAYFILVPHYAMKKIAMLNKIIKGSEEIMSGNLNYSINEKGKGSLVNLAHNINNMKDGYKKSLENQVKNEKLKSELITNVSHDLKTPLTSIINYVDLLHHTDLSKEESLKYIKKLHKNSQKLKILIDDLFEASKIASGAIELNIERVNVVAILRQSLGELVEQIENSSLNFIVNLPNHEIFLNLDGKKIWRVFDNLIGNILKYSMPHSRVYIDLKEDDHKVKIIMKNISSYQMNFEVYDMFERFKRGDKSRNTEGSGLGLAIAKDIVELQEGKMDISVDGDLFKVVIILNKQK
ncbi:sensor histidine kinase [Clostridium sediminicola]|uniref:sensor histidine kinase n=1 Tax=Clostridium sediminicola TaxID=3114879 RepID=UPI0031F2547A